MELSGDGGDPSIVRNIDFNGTYTAYGTANEHTVFRKYLGITVPEASDGGQPTGPDVEVYLEIYFDSEGPHPNSPKAWLIRIGPQISYPAPNTQTVVFHHRNLHGEHYTNEPLCPENTEARMCSTTEMDNGPWLGSSGNSNRTTYQTASQIFQRKKTAPHRVQVPHQTPSPSPSEPPYTDNICVCGPDGPVGPGAYAYGYATGCYEFSPGTGPTGQDEWIRTVTTEALSRPIKPRGYS